MLCIRVLSIKLMEIFKFLNKIIIKNPIEYSIPAKANIKKEFENKFKSSKFKPNIILIEYKTTQLSSEYRNIKRKLLKFIKKPIIDIQNIIKKKSIHKYI